MNKAPEVEIARTKIVFIRNLIKITQRNMLYVTDIVGFSSIDHGVCYLGQNLK
jgi:hypothetical protein